MNNFYLKKYLAEGKLLKEEEQGYTLYTTNVEYDNGKTGYMYQLVNSEDGEENEIGFDQLYFVGKGDASDPQVFVDKDFKNFDQGSYQEEELSAEEAMKIYNDLAEGKQLKEETDDSVKTDTPIKKSKMKKSKLKEMIKAAMMSEVQYDIDDTNSDYDFLAEEYEATSYDKLVGPVIMGIGNIKKYVQTSAPEYLDSLIAAEDAFMAFNDKMAYGDDDLGVPGDNALGLEENRSEFDTNKPARIAEFIKALDMLVDEYHAELYLSDDLFSAVEMVKKAANEAINLNEAEEEVEDEEVDVKVGDEEIETTDVETTTEVDPNVKAVQDALTAAQAAAADLGDEKLTDQIGNTITFFTRQHVANIDSMNEMDVQDAADDTETKIDSVAAAMIGLNESRNRMLKLAGIIK